MSRSRLVVSLALIMVALASGGRFAVQAFPLTAVVAADSPIVAAPAPAPPSLPAAGAPVLPVTSVPVAAAPPSSAGTDAAAPSPVAQDTPAAGGLHSKVAFVRAVQRPEPAVTQTTPGDAIVVIGATVDTAGMTAGPIELESRPGPQIRLTGRDVAQVESMLSRGTFMERGGVTAAQQEQLRAALDTLSAWRFEPPAEPVRTAVGFNFARTEQSGVETEPVRVGGDVRAPIKLKDVRPVYPLDAQAKGIQGVVILELVIDGAGIPVSAYAIRPVEGLTMAAIQAALAWRFMPDQNYSRRLMTVTVNFTLSGGVPAGVAGGVQGGVAGGVEGGIAGGVPAGVSGGVPGGIAGGIAGGGPVPSFGPPRAEWPTTALRVGGDIKMPIRIRDVRPVYPQEAQYARVQGVVIVEALIGTDGKVQAARILRSIPMLDQAAMDAVKQWEYTPTLVNGVAVPIAMTLTVNFTMQ